MEWTDDPCWDSFVNAMLKLGHVQERRSRYGDKPALYLDGREIAHLDAPGVIDLRITHAGWSQVKDGYKDDSAVRRDPSRRDWLELFIESDAEIERLTAMLAVSVVANRK